MKGSASSFSVVGLGSSSDCRFLFLDFLDPAVLIEDRS